MMMMIMKIFVLKFLITVWENFKENLKEVKRFFTHSENINDAINDVTSITFWLNIFRTTGFYQFCSMTFQSCGTHHKTHILLSTLSNSFNLKGLYYFHCPHSMCSRVYYHLSGVRPSVCLSVCLSVPAWATAANFGPMGRRYRSIPAAAAGKCG